MHANSNTDFQDPIPVQYSTIHSKCVSSNRIKIQEILLILQLETDYFSRLFISEMHQSSDTTVFTETSRTAILHEEVLQDSSAPILQGYPYNHTTIQPYNHTSYIIYIHMCTHPCIQRILHPESNSTCRRQRALRVLLHSRKEILHIEGKGIS